MAISEGSLEIIIMAAKAASGHPPNQEEEGEHLDISAVFSDHENGKPVGSAISTGREYVDEKLQYQDVLESSFSSSLIISPQATGSDFQHSPSEIDDGSDHWQSPIQVFHVAAASSSRTEDLALCICKICEEIKPKNEMIRVNKTCFHSFCSNCVSKHVETRITGNRVIVPCPGLDCEHLVEFESCLGFVPNEVLEAWGWAIYESQIPDAHKFYCPFRDCSVMLENDSEMMVEESECPYCHRLFCAQCRVPWHAGWSCEEFRALSEDERGNEDFMLRKLAAEKKWGRCPKCKFYVERTDGCPHITCRCGYEFCYGCESQWGEDHGGCCRG